MIRNIFINIANTNPVANAVRAVRRTLSQVVQQAASALEQVVRFGQQPAPNMPAFNIHPQQANANVAGNALGMLGQVGFLGQQLPNTVLVQQAANAAALNQGLRILAQAGLLGQQVAAPTFSLPRGEQWTPSRRDAG